MPQAGFIIKRSMPIHDLDDLCQYGQRLLAASDPRSYDFYDSLEKAQATGGYPCKACMKIRDSRRHEAQLL